MPLPTQWARVAFNFYGQEKQWQNILFFTLNGAFSGSWNIATAAAALDTKFRPKIVPWLNVECVYNGVDLRVSNVGLVTSVSTFPNVSGTALGDPTPDEVAAVVRLQTDQPGKSGRGRMYLSGMGSSFFDNGRITPAAHTVFQNFATEVQTHMADQGVDWHAGVYSRHNDALHDILTTSVPVTVATQRRRRLRR